ncbi:MAG: ammonium transporter [Dehalococcoidia bacterium]|nr:ammonium transporter [Dehalococcoidia bacterium]
MSAVMVPFKRHRVLVLAVLVLLTIGIFSVRPALAQSTGVNAETQFVLNTFAFLAWGALVMWMCAGFTMLEAGSVRTKNASMICLKNIGLYSIAGLAFFFIGYNLMYTDVWHVIGSFEFLYGPSDAEVSLIEGNTGATAEVVGNSYSTMSDWFFQMVFVATTASIVSGAIAERARLWVFFLFILVLTAFIYPVVGAWTWGGGWLGDRGFQDFAGSTIVHSTGGWAALAGVMVIGPRLGKFRRDGSPRPTPPSNILSVTLGVFILWLGWFGFNGGSQLALGSALDAVAMSHVLVNTNLAAAAGVVVALLVSRPILGRMDLFAGLNGAIAGLVSITAGPDIVDHYWAVVIGAVGGAICVGAIRLMEMVKLDDVVGAIPAHLFAGVWGTLAVCIAAGGQFHIQLLGVVSIGAFVFGVSYLLEEDRRSQGGALGGTPWAGHRRAGDRSVPRICVDARAGRRGQLASCCRAAHRDFTGWAATWSGRSTFAGCCACRRRPWWTGPSGRYIRAGSVSMTV